MRLLAEDEKRLKRCARTVLGSVLGKVLLCEFWRWVIVMVVMTDGKKEEDKRKI